MIAAVPGAGSVALIWPTPATCADLVCAFDAECKALARAAFARRGAARVIVASDPRSCLNAASLA